MERKMIGIIAVIVVIVVIVAAVATIELLPKKGGNGNTTTPKLTITEGGSTLLEPVFDAYAPNYTAGDLKPSGGGSGLGISSAAAGTNLIGGSDAYLLTAQVSQYPYLLNIPVMISYQYVAYNVPSLNNIHLNLNGTLVGDMYSGAITNWDSPLIQAANPGVTLPNATIVPVHRSDGSGDTFMFSSFLYHSSPTWASYADNHSFRWATSIAWPSLPTAQAETGNSGIINYMDTTPNTVGYIAATYTSTLTADHFGIANLQDKNGQYVGATVANVSNAASGFLSSIPANGTVPLQYAPGNDAYPIADMEYVMVKENQTATGGLNSSQVASALQAFIKWIVNSTSGGSTQAYMTQFNLVALPNSVVTAIVDPLINKIHG